MTITQQGTIPSEQITIQIHRYTAISFSMSAALLLITSILLSYQMTGLVSVSGMIQALLFNPVLWCLTLFLVLMIALSMSFFSTLNRSYELLVEARTRAALNISGDLESELHYKNKHDPLTNLPNEHLMRGLIAQSIQKLSNGDGLAVIVIKINDFKDINYKFGSLGANNVLVHFADELKLILLEPCMLQPNMGMNIVARIQGSEFSIVIPRLRKEHLLENIIKTIQEKIIVDFRMEGLHVTASTTMGVAQYPMHGKTQELLLSHAMTSLHHAEKAGTPWALYDASMDSKKMTHVKKAP